MDLSPHFSLAEATFSSTAMRHGIPNAPSLLEIDHMKIAAMGMESVRILLNDLPIHIDSWYRCGILNGIVCGSKQSAHMTGYAIDFICNPYTPLRIVQAISDHGIEFDQLIQEGNWVHISFAPAMRMEILTAHFNSLNGITTYSKGIV